MDQLAKLARTYRLTSSLPERERLADQICTLIEQDLSFFVFAAVRPPAAEDVLQELLKGIFKSLSTFEGASKEEFWGWCYQIARNKVKDHLRKKESDRLQPMPDDQLHELVEGASQATPLSASDKMDLEYAMKLLEQSKPECRKYLWEYFVIGFDYAEIAEEQNLSYDSVRMRIGRCLDDVKKLIS